MSNEVELTINGKTETYIPKSSIQNPTPTKKQIIVCDRGWVLVGDVSSFGDYIEMINVNVIRRWGTTKGLGELAENGPLENTKLDPCPPCQFHKLSIILKMNCNELKW